MNKWKRVLSLFLSLCICFSLAMPTFATDATADDDTQAIVSTDDIGAVSEDNVGDEDETETVTVTDTASSDEEDTEIVEDIPSDSEDAETDVPSDPVDTATNIPANEGEMAVPASEPESAAPINESENSAPGSVVDAPAEDLSLSETKSDIEAVAPVRQSVMRIAAAATWQFWRNTDFSDNAGHDNCYLLHGTRTSGQKGYGIDAHKASISGSSTEYWAYCLDHGKTSSASPDSNYNVTTLPSGEKYQAARYVVALGYGNNTTDELNRIWGYSMTGWEWVEATQAAVWIAQYVADGTYSSVDSAMTSQRLNIRLTSQHSDSNARKAARDLALAGLALWNDGNSLTIQAPTVTESTSYVTYRIQITGRNVYGGYKATITGLNNTCTITGSSNVTVSGVSSFSSTTVTGTDTITIQVPKTASVQKLNVTMKLSSNSKQYANNGAVLYAKSNNSSTQDFMVADGNVSPLAKNASYNWSIPRLPTGSITITKRDAVTNETVRGVVFALYEYNGSTYVDTGTRATTNANGVASFTNLQYTSANIGRYEVFEVSSTSTHQVWTDRYVIAVSLASGAWYAYTSATATRTSGTASQNSSGNYDFTFTTTAYNNPIEGSLAVYKQDSETGQPLANCVFELYEYNAPTAWVDGNGTWVSTGITAVTDSTGRATFSNLKVTSANVGKFQVREVSAPDGYEVDTRFRGSVKLATGYYSYVSSLVPLTSGWLARADYPSSVSADINGQQRTLFSAKANNTGGYDFTVYLGDSRTPTEARLQVYKIVSDSNGEDVFLSGAAFALMEQQADGTWSEVYQLKEGMNIPGFYSIASDYENRLEYEPTVGKTYKVIEKAAPAGVINIGWESEAFVWGDAANLSLSFECQDQIPTGALQIKKTDAETGLPLAGVTFSVKAAEDITCTLNGETTVLYQAGHDFGTLTTDSNGVAGLTDLYYGKYILTETSTIDNYKLDDVTFTAVVGAPSAYSPSDAHSDSSGIGVTTYTGVATVTDYQEYHAAEYAKYVKDNRGYVVRYNRDGNGIYTQADNGTYAQVAYASVTNAPLHPKMAVAKLTDRTTNPNGGNVEFDAAAGRYTQEKIPGTYYDHQTVTFTLTATNTGNVDLFNPYIVDVMSDDIWTVVENSNQSNADTSVRTTDVTFRAADGTELTAGSAVATTAGKTATIQNVSYDDVAKTYTIKWDELDIGDSLNVYLTFTLMNYDAINKNALPNDVYLYGQYLSNGTSGDLTDVPGGGEDEYDCHDRDAINVVSVGSITIHKTDSSGAVAGAKFHLTDKDGKAVQFVVGDDGSYSGIVVADNGDWVLAGTSGKQTVSEIVTNSNGYAELVNLPVGDYTLTELSTTNGHTLLADAVSITLPYVKEGADQNADDAVVVTDPDGIVRTYYYHLTYDISNTAVFKLPSTGGYSMWWIALGVCLSGIVLTFSIRRKDKDSER